MTDRESFEAFVKNAKSHKDFRHDTTAYLDDSLEWMWMGWQAATIAERERVINICERYKGSEYYEMATDIAEEIRGE